VWSRKESRRWRSWPACAIWACTTPRATCLRAPLRRRRASRGRSERALESPRAVSRSSMRAPTRRHPLPSALNDHGPPAAPLRLHLTLPLRKIFSRRFLPSPSLPLPERGARGQLRTSPRHGKAACIDACRTMP